MGRRPNSIASKLLTLPTKKHIDIVYMFPYYFIMKIEYSLHGILFEWDSNKSETNLQKHGITILKGDIFRIISARPVTKHERKEYEDQ
jgi:hypothetical protein